MINDGGFKGGGGYAYVRERLGIVSVKDFGAAGNGVTDDTAAIQAALDVGGVVEIPTGTYNISTTLSVGQNTMIRGVGWNNSIINYSGDTSAVQIAGNNVFLTNLLVNCTGTPTSGGAIATADDLYGVYLSRVMTQGGYYGLSIGYNLNTVWLDHLYVTGSYGGLFCQSGANDSNSVYRGGSVGVQLDSASGAFNSSQSASYGPLAFWTTNSKGVDAPNMGIWLWNFQCNVESGTPPTGTTSGNIFLQNWAGQVHLFGCWATNSNYGLYALGVTNYSTPALEIQGGTWSGIILNLAGNPDNLQSIVINGASIIAPGGNAGISIGPNTGWMTFTNNLFIAWSTGIEFTQSGNFFGPFHIEGNTFIDVTTPFNDVNNQSISGLYLKNNTGYNPVGPLTPPASPFVSGAVYQNTSGVVMTIYQPVYATTSGTAGSVAVALGSSDTPSTLFTDYVPGDTSSTVPKVEQLRVPPGWYYSFTVTNATLSDAQIQGE